MNVLRAKVKDEKETMYFLSHSAAEDSNRATGAKARGVFLRPEAHGLLVSDWHEDGPSGTWTLYPWHRVLWCEVKA